MSILESLVANLDTTLFDKAYAKAYSNVSSEMSAGEDWCIYNGLVSAMSVIKEFLLGDSTDENDETIADGE